MLTSAQRKQAISWYCSTGADLTTIAQHFDISVEVLKKEMRRDHKVALLPGHGCYM